MASSSSNLFAAKNTIVVHKARKQPVVSHVDEEMELDPSDVEMTDSTTVTASRSSWPTPQGSNTPSPSTAYPLFTPQHQQQRAFGRRSPVSSPPSASSSSEGHLQATESPSWPPRAGRPRSNPVNPDDKPWHMQCIWQQRDLHPTQSPMETAKEKFPARSSTKRKRDGDEEEDEERDVEMGGCEGGLRRQKR